MQTLKIMFLKPTIITELLKRELEIKLDELNDKWHYTSLEKIFFEEKIYKELERQLKQLESSLSPEKVIDILKTIYKVSFQSPYSYNIHSKLLLKNAEQTQIVELFNLEL